MPSLIVAGPHVVCYINGRVYGQVISATWNSSTPKKAIYTIDTPDPSELAVTTTKVSGSLELYRLTGTGGLQGAGIAASFRDLSLEKYFVLQLIDRRTDTPLFECRDCSSEGEQWKIGVKALMTGTLNFSGIIWDNESTQK